MTDHNLLEASFYQHPLFKRDPYASHVKHWQRFVQSEVWERYWTDPTFAAAHDARHTAGQIEAGRFLSSLPWRAAA